MKGGPFESLLHNLPVRDAHTSLRSRHTHIHTHTIKIVYFSAGATVASVGGAVLMDVKPARHKPIYKTMSNIIRYKKYTRYSKGLYINKNHKIKLDEY